MKHTIMQEASEHRALTSTEQLNDKQDPFQDIREREKFPFKLSPELARPALPSTDHGGTIG